MRSVYFVRTAVLLNIVITIIYAFAAQWILAILTLVIAFGLFAYWEEDYAGDNEVKFDEIHDLSIVEEISDQSFGQIIEKILGTWLFNQSLLFSMLFVHILWIIFARLVSLSPTWYLAPIAFLGTILVMIFGIIQAIYVMIKVDLDIEGFSSFFVFIAFGISIFFIELGLVIIFITGSLEPTVVMVMLVMSSIWIGLPVYLPIVVIGLLLGITVFILGAYVGFKLGEDDGREIIGLLSGGFLGGAAGIILFQLGAGLAFWAFVAVNSPYQVFNDSIRGYLFNFPVLLGDGGHEIFDDYLGLGVILMMFLAFFLGYVEGGTFKISELSKKTKNLYVSLKAKNWSGANTSGKPLLILINMSLRINLIAGITFSISIPWLFPFMTLFNQLADWSILGKIFSLIFLLLGIKELSARFENVAMMSGYQKDYDFWDLSWDSRNKRIFSIYYFVSIILLFGVINLIAESPLAKYAIGLILFETVGYFIRIFVNLFRN